MNTKQHHNNGSVNSRFSIIFCRVIVDFQLFFIKNIVDFQKTISWNKKREYVLIVATLKYMIKQDFSRLYYD
jgi:hypothetical protein